VGYFKAKVQSLLGEDGDFRSELRAGTKDALVGMLVEMLKQVALQLIVALAVKIISLLNPAGAIVQILRTAYDAVMFFINNMGRILKLFDTARQAFMTAVQGGGVGAIAGKVESLLAGAVVPSLDAVARLIGIGSLPSKIRAVLMTLKRLAQKPARAFLSAIGRPLSRLFDKALAFFGLTGIKPKPLIEPSACQSKPGQSPKQQTRVWVQPEGQVMVQDQMQQRRPLEEYLHTLPGASPMDIAAALKSGKHLSSEATALKAGLDAHQKRGTIKSDKQKLDRVRAAQMDLQNKVCPLLTGEQPGGGPGMACMGPTCKKCPPPKKKPFGLPLPRPPVVPRVPAEPPPAQVAAKPAPLMQPARQELPKPPPPPSPLVGQSRCSCDCSETPPVITMSAGGSCFGFGQPVPKTAFGNDATGTIVPGDKLLPEELTPEQRGGRPAPADTPVDPVGWRLLRLRIAKDSDDTLEIARFFEMDWLSRNNVEVDGQVWLDLDHMGVWGWALVTAVEACPQLATGPGRRVMGTFKYSRGRVYDLQVEGEPKPIRVTGAHPFWSPDRNGWVAVQDLQSGERLLGLHGPVKVIGLALRAEEEPVYNIEVDGDHVYRVGEQGLLVHNVSQTCSLFSEKYFGGDYMTPGMKPAVTGPGGRAELKEARVCSTGQPRPALANPVGWNPQWNTQGLASGQYRVARCHLLGNQFGGSNKADNLVPCCQTENQRMAAEEDDIAHFIRDNGGCVDIRVSASYTGPRSRIPRTITLEAKGRACDGPCESFFVKITNPASLFSCPVVG